MQISAPHIPELGDNAKARESFERSLQLNPGQFSAYYGLGRLLESEARYVEAAADFQRSADLSRLSIWRLGRVLPAARKRPGIEKRICEGNADGSGFAGRQAGD